jgi:RecB family exonuclease
MFKVFYTPLDFKNPAGLLFKEAISGVKGNDFSDILYIAPSSAKIEDARKIFHGLNKNQCYIPPQMATVSLYCKKLYSERGYKRMIKNSLMPVILSGLSGKGIGFSAIAADFISSVKQRFPDKDIDSIRNGFIAAFHELNIPDVVSKAVMESLGLFAAYGSFLEKNGLVDEDDVINKSGGLLPDNPCLTLILDGFYDPAPSETLFLKALIERSKNCFVLIPHDSRFVQLTEGFAGFLKDNFPLEEIYLKGDREKNFVYCPFNGIEEEVEGIARHIKALYVSGRFRELENAIVTFPDLSRYSDMSERVFKRYGIPYEISAGRPLGKMRPFLDLFCLLHSIAEGYPRLKFSQFLSSKYFSKMPESIKKWLPMLSLQSGIVSGRDAWLDFVSKGSETLDTNAIKEQPELENGLRWVFEKLRTIEKIGEKTGSGAPVDVYAKSLQELLRELGFLEAAQDEETKSLSKAAKEIFDQIYFIGRLCPEPVSFPEFIEMLGYLFNASHAETSGSGVKIMDFREACLLSPEYLYFGGLTDGDMPKRPDTDYLLPDSVKKKLGLLSLDKHIAVQKFGFHRLISSCGNPHLSYPLMEGDDMFLPSSFLYSGEEARENIPGIFSMEEYLIRSGKRPFSEYISEIAVSKPHSLKSGFLRVTDIDAYRTCRRKFFIERMLNLKPVNIKEYEIEAATLGTIIHKIMERIIKEPFDDMGNLKKRAGEIIEDTTKDKRIGEYWKKLIRDTFIEILPGIYENELEIRSDEYISTEVEKTIAGEPIKGIRLKGKIDRFDKIGDGVQIIDYKTGGATLNCKQVLEGNENLQLFLYAAIMKNQGYKVDRAGIYSLKDIQIKWCPPKKKGQRAGGKGQEDMDGYIIAALQFLEEAANGLRSGDFKAKPINDYICRNCHEYAFCPYVQQ